MPRILIVDDDPSFGLMVKKFLEKQGFDVTEVLTGKSCLEQMNHQKFDLALLDFRLPDMDGLDLLKAIRQKHSPIPVILMTSYANIRIAVKAIQMGAFEYLVKPINPDETLLLINQALNQKVEVSNVPKADASKAGQPEEKVSGKNTIKFIEGTSKESAEIMKYIDLVAPTNLSVIILGESGTGKEYVSRMIHQKSKRAAKPFVAIDCGALSEELAGSELFGHLKGAFTGAVTDKVGQFQAANGGTLFLDEIGNLSYEVQVKLLRAIQEGMVRKIGSNKDEAVDVRIITATNEDLAEAAKRGDFREDLYHRLNEFKIKVPPLRERKEDISIFAEHFLQQSNHELDKEVKKFSDKVIQYFMEYNWPGNLREFKNIVRRAVLLSTGEAVEPETLPEEITNPVIVSTTQSEQITGASHATSNLKEMIEINEKATIIRTLEQVKYNKSKAARILNIDRKTLYNKLKQYGIDA
ncbi:MAG: sigma-54 dependent transcriptional regulator [Bacteroidota bacterium]